MIKSIPLVHPSLLNQRVTDFLEGFLELHENYIRYRMCFYASQPVDINDESLGWENDILTDIDQYILRSAIIGAIREVTYNGAWRVGILMSESAGYFMYFKTEQEANDFLNELMPYILSKNENTPRHP